MPDTPPEVGSLWLHESGERRYVTDVWDSPLFKLTRVQFHGPDGMQTVDLPDWLAWHSAARRIDNA